MRHRTFWGRLAALALVAAAVFYLARTIGVNWAELRRFEWNVRWVPLAVSIPLHVLVLVWGVWIWGRVLGHLGHSAIPQLVLSRIWFLSNLARYIPGKVFQFVAAAQLSRSSGLSAPVMLTSLLVSTCISVLAAGLLGSWTLLAGSLWLPAIASVVCLGALHPGVINRILGAVPRILHKEVIRWSGSWWDGLGLLGLSAIGWIGYGVAYHLFIWSIAEVPWELFPQMVGVNCLSFVLGYVSLLPGGLGVREVAMTELLNPYLPAGVGAVLALAARLWTIVTELLGGATVAGFASRNSASSDGRVGPGGP